MSAAALPCRRTRGQKTTATPPTLTTTPGRCYTHRFDTSFLRELFLQCLPSNVCMVLASSGNSISLDQLAQLADCIVDVATPTLASVTAPQSSHELEQLCSEISQLQAVTQTNDLVFLVAAAHPALSRTTSAGTIASLATKPTNIPHSAPSRETTRPVASGYCGYCQLLLCVPSNVYVIA